MNTRTHFTESEIERFQPAEKVGLLATISGEGKPHISLITSLQALDATHMVFGEFSKGLSKRHVQSNPRAGFLIMTLDRKMWRGKAAWTHMKTEGAEYEMFNDKPMFRYNTYFGINTVHYLDLVETGGEEGLPMGAIIRSALATKAAKGAARNPKGPRALNHLAEELFNGLGSLKFVSWIGDDGYPLIVPAIQCQAADAGRIAFSPGAFGTDLARIPEGKEVAVFALTMQMEDVLARGTYLGTRRYRGITLGTIDIDWVYNPMPPAHGQVYPPIPLTPVEQFDQG
jgi:hypothetical protein